MKKRVVTGLLACLFAALTVFAALPVMAEESPDDVVLRFGVLSDVHYGRNNNINNKFKKALQILKSKAGGADNLDALLICGDMTNGGETGQWDNFISGLQSEFPSGSKTQMVMVRGNHDCYPSSTGANKENFVTKLSAAGYLPAEGNQTCFMVDVKGYKFIAVGQDSGNAVKSGLHSAETIAEATRLVQEAAAADPTGEKPIFFGMHPHMDNEDSSNNIIYKTVYGSERYPGTVKPGGSSYWATPDLFDAVKDYKQVITFSGHSHFNITDERSIHQQDFTSIGTGEIAYTELEDSRSESFHPTKYGSFENESVGHYIEVHRDNSVTVHRLDFYRDEEIKQPWVIKNVNDPAWLTYTDDRDQIAPKFAANTTPIITNIGTGSYTATFEQAADAETDVHYYLLESVNTATNEVEDSKDFFSHEYQNSGMPKTLSWEASNLQPGTRYKARVTAYDAYDNASTPIESAAFTTSDKLEGIPTALADAYFMKDGGIGDASAYSNTNKLLPYAVGTPSTVYSDTQKRYVAQFDGTATNYFKVLLDAGRRSAMENNYTIEFYAKFADDIGTGNNYPIGAAQSGGFDVETASSNTKLAGWAKHNGAGRTVATIDIPTGYFHYIMTYNGSALTVYKDGVQAGTLSTSGALEWPSAVPADTTYGMLIGGDYNPNNTDGIYADQEKAQSPFHGEIAFARIYGSAIDAATAKTMYQAVQMRPQLTKLDALKTMVETTLPALKEAQETEENKTKIDAVIKEGWDLSASALLTDEKISAYLETAETKWQNAEEPEEPTVLLAYSATDMKDKTLKDYGLTVNTGDNGCWSCNTYNNEDTVGRDALRFSLRGGNKSADEPDGYLYAQKPMFTWDFTKDTVNNPPAFSGKGYTYEMEFSVLNKEKGATYDFTLNGNTAAQEAKDILHLCFECTASGQSSQNASGNAYMVDAADNAVGNKLTQRLSVNDKTAAVLNYLRIDLDMEHKTYSAWLVKRKETTGAYTEAMPSDSTLLVANQPFNNTDVVQVTGTAGVFNFPAPNKLSSGAWIHNVTVSEFDPPEQVFTAAVEVDETAIVPSGTVGLTLTTANSTTKDEAVLLIAALKDSDATDAALESAKAYLVKVPANQGKKQTLYSVPLPADSAGKRLEVYLWREDLRPINHVLGYTVAAQ